MTLVPDAVDRACRERTDPSATGFTRWYLALNSALVIGWLRLAC